MPSPAQLTLPKIPRSVRALAASPIIVAFLAAVRLLVICNYDPTTATRMAETGGIIGTLLGTIVPLLPPYMPLVFVVLIIFRRWFLTLLSGAATALVSPAYTDAFHGITKTWQDMRLAADATRRHQWLYLWNHDKEAIFCIALGVTLAFWAALRLLIHAFTGSRNAWLKLLLVPAFFTYGLIISVVATSALLLVQNFYVTPLKPANLWATARHPWLPTEELQLNSNHTVVGYVLSTNDGWFAVLLESSRTIDYIHASNITGRMVCAAPDDVQPKPLPLIHPPSFKQALVNPCPTG